MPEGDTIWRTARSIERWIGGRTVTSARSRDCRLGLGVLEGDRVSGVRAVGKHLLIEASSGRVLHSHMMMTGSWHCYLDGTPWRRGRAAAVAVIETGERLAVCFDAPVMELLSPRAAQAHPVLSALGPDVLAERLDSASLRARIESADPMRTLGDLLLDQTVVAGIGNIYRCESLFLTGLDPRASLASAGVPALEKAVVTSRRLMAANLGHGVGFDRDFGRGRGRPWVYRRAGHPCRRCGSKITSAQMGQWLRRAYWCPLCQGRS